MLPVHRTRAQVGHWLEALRQRARRARPAQHWMQMAGLIYTMLPTSFRMGQLDGGCLLGCGVGSGRLVLI